jgi:hypothetical protein
MVIFMVNRGNLQSRALHNRLKKRLRTDYNFQNTRSVVAAATEPGKYRAIGEIDPRQFLDDTSYGATTARVEVGFDLNTSSGHEHYWLNWIEPDRSMLVGWHQDSMHLKLGKVHLQVDDDGRTVTRKSATFIDSHPVDVFLQRMDVLPQVVQSVTWQNGRPTGSTW